MSTFFYAERAYYAYVWRIICTFWANWG